MSDWRTANSSGDPSPHSGDRATSQEGGEGAKDGIFQLCDVVRETAFELHQYLKCGHLEKVYENGLAHRLRGKGVTVQQQFPLSVRDEDGTVLGEYFVDLFADNQLIVEIKAVDTLVDQHRAQLIGYLKGTRVEHGLLINFGAPRLQVKKFVLSRG